MAGPFSAPSLPPLYPPSQVFNFPPNEKSQFPSDIVDQAIRKGDTNLIAKVLRDETLLDYEDSYDHNFIHKAIIFQKPSIIALLLELRVPADHINDSGPVLCTTLSWKVI